MFCRKCGETLLDDDRFCPYCGAQVIERKKDEESKAEKDTVHGEVKERHYFSEMVKPNWNLDAFPDTEAEPRKTEDILVDWKQNILIEPTFKPEKDMSFSEQLQAFDSGLDLSTKPVEENVAKSTLVFERTTTAEVEENESETTVETANEDEIKKDRFYTFSQKNAEFQKLLDKEYEKIKAGRDETFNEIKELKEQTSDAAVAEQENPKIEIEEKVELEKKVEPQDEKAPEASKIEVAKFEEVDERPEPEKLAQAMAEVEKTPSEPGLDWEQQAPPFEDEVNGGDKKTSILVVILSIIIVLLGLSIAALAVEQFAPNSAPGKTVHIYLEKTRDFFRGDSA